VVTKEQRKGTRINDKEKSEIRSTKSETSTKVQNYNVQNKKLLNFDIWSFEFVPDFDIRISDLNQ